MDEEEPMRLLCAADLHGIRETYSWLLTEALHVGVDAVILAGDLLGCPDGFDTPEDAQRFDAVETAALLERAGSPVLYVMGNDDLVELAPASPRLRSIHGRKVTCGAFSFVGYQYSLPFMGGTFEKPDEAIATDLAELEPLLDASTIFVSHSPAWGILDPGFGDVRIGSRSLRALLERRPCLAHIHGHSHAGFGRARHHLNVAAAGQRRAIILDLPTMVHRVVYG